LNRGSPDSAETVTATRIMVRVRTKPNPVRGDLRIETRALYQFLFSACAATIVSPLKPQRARVASEKAKFIEVCYAISRSPTTWVSPGRERVARTSLRSPKDAVILVEAFALRICFAGAVRC